MTPEQFFSKVAAMRRAQIAYIEHHDPITLRRCRAIERQIDDEIRRVATLKARQKRDLIPTLF